MAVGPAAPEAGIADTRGKWQTSWLFYGHILPLWPLGMLSFQTQWPYPLLWTGLQVEPVGICATFSWKWNLSLDFKQPEWRVSLPCERYIIWREPRTQDCCDTLNLECGHGSAWKPTSASAGFRLKHITALTSSSLCMVFGSHSCNFREEASWQQYKACRAAGWP